VILYNGDEEKGDYPGQGKVVYVQNGRLKTAWRLYEDDEKEGWLIDGQEQIKWKRKNTQ